MTYLFSSESVSSGHPDKISDIISDTILDNFLSFDSQSRVACETLVTTGQVIISGEVTSSTYIDIENLVRNTINEIGYNKSEYMFSGDSCGIISLLHEQSEDINQGITKSKEEMLGAGDQGIMFGYATNETNNYIPLSLDLSHRIMEFIEHERRSKKNIDYLRPDAKAQVTVKYSENHKIIGVDSIVISTQHDDFIVDDEKLLNKLRDDITELVKKFLINDYDSNIPDLFSQTKFLINPAGKFVIGGPHGDTGLTGRKIIVDSYGGKGAHGGGAFSGKDSTKVDRSAAYMARYVAKNLVAAGVSSEAQIQLAYAIGIAEPVSLCVNTFGKSKFSINDAEISKIIMNNFDFTPFGIQNRFNLKNPIYRETASYGHFGRIPKTVTKVFENQYKGKIEKKVELFPWEEINLVSELKKLF